MSYFPLKTRPVTRQQVHRPSRLLLLERLEDRVVPTQLGDGWIVFSNYQTDINQHYLSGIYAVDPSGNKYTISNNSGHGGYFAVPGGLFENPTTGMLYVPDEGLLNGRAIIPYTGSLIQVDPNTAVSDDNSGIQTRISYNSNLWGTDGVVYINGAIYVIDQGDGGGNLHLLPNPNNSSVFDAPSHDLVKIDLNTGSQTQIAAGVTNTVPTSP